MPSVRKFMVSPVVVFGQIGTPSGRTLQAWGHIGARMNGGPREGTPAWIWRDRWAPAVLEDFTVGRGLTVCRRGAPGEWARDAERWGRERLECALCVLKSTAVEAQTGIDTGGGGRTDIRLEAIRVHVVINAVVYAHIVTLYRRG
jgi:hypothetical protein